MKKLFEKIAFIPITIWMTVGVVSALHFNADCESHLRRAAEAKSAPIACMELGGALQYLQGRALTDGSTAVFAVNASNDIGGWYRGLAALHGELMVLDTKASLKPEGRERERTVLLKVEQYVLNGTAIRVPRGISLHPLNFSYALLGTLSVVFLLFGSYNTFRRSWAVWQMKHQKTETERMGYGYATNG